jgi:secreted trypsin-like serine protease
MAAILPVLLPLLLAAGPVSAADADAKIVNGEEEDGYDATVALGASLGSNTFSACTGSLITPRVILSAAHCGADIPLELVVSAGVAFFGPDILDPDFTIGFEDMAVHPDYVELANGMGGTLGENDVAVLILAEDAPDSVAPFWLRQEELTEDLEGAMMTSIGFGITGSDGRGSGTKRSVELRLDEVDDVFLLSEGDATEGEGQICSGDSGGPQVVTLEDGRVQQWAVHSWGDQDCESVSGSTRVDVVYSWVTDQVEAVHGTRDYCEINGRYGDGVCDTFCEGSDPDCEDAVADASEDEDKGRCSTVALNAAVVPGLLAMAAVLGRRRERDDVC